MKTWTGLGLRVSTSTQICQRSDAPCMRSFHTNSGEIVRAICARNAQKKGRLKAVLHSQLYLKYLKNIAVLGTFNTTSTPWSSVLLCKAERRGGSEAYPKNRARDGADVG